MAPPGLSAFQPNYLRVLLSACNINKSIPHFRPDSFYLAMLEGREHEVKKNVVVSR